MQVLVHPCSHHKYEFFHPCSVQLVQFCHVSAYPSDTYRRKAACQSANYVPLLIS